MPNGACSGQVCQAVWAQGAGRCQTNHPWRNRAISQFLLTVTPGQRLAVTRVCATHVTRWHMWHGDTYHTITHVTHITQGHSRHLLAMLTSRQICRALGSGINKMAIARRLLCRSCPNPEGFECLIHRLFSTLYVTHHFISCVWFQFWDILIHMHCAQACTNFHCVCHSLKWSNCLGGWFAWERH